MKILGNAFSKLRKIAMCGVQVALALTVQSGCGGSVGCNCDDLAGQGQQISDNVLSGDLAIEDAACQSARVTLKMVDCRCCDQLQGQTTCEQLDAFRPQVQALMNAACQ